MSRKKTQENQNKDEQYLQAGEAYLNAAHDQPPYSRIESTLLKASFI